MDENSPPNLHEFLSKISLTKYTALLAGQGYEEWQDICLLEPDDLDSVQIKDPADRSVILNAVNDIDAAVWLRQHNLEQYEPQFKRHNICTVADLKTQIMSDDIMDELEVMVPGHRKRLQNAASHICIRDSPEPVAFGHWGKKDAIPTTNEDLLWLENCRIQSNIDGQEPVLLRDCMVDTGSEVSTIKEDIMPQLQLQFLHNVKSKGIHRVEDKPLYKGIFIIGNNHIEVDGPEGRVHRFQFEGNQQLHGSTANFY